MQPVWLVLLTALYLLLFLAPGLVLASLLRCCWPLRPALVTLLAVVFSSLLGYAVFWVYFFSPAAGRWASYTVLGLAGAVVTFAAVGCLLPWARQRGILATLLAADVALPMLLMFLVACAYLGLVYGVSFDHELDWHHVNERFTFYLTPDNVIPLYFAQGMHDGNVPRPLVADWLSSDRPPLQTGLVLVQYPIWNWTKQPPDLNYEIVSTLLQLSWVPAVWALCQGAGLGYRRTAVVFAFLIANGFFYLNSVFVWPKLLAGSLAIAAVLLLLQPLGERATWTEIVLAAVAASLGLLAHGGVFFTLLPLAGWLLLNRGRFPGWMKSAAAVAVVAGLLAPWMAYQRFHEPPGNRLVKWHLAGVVPIDERSTWQAIRDNYANETVWGLVSGRVQNVGALAAPGYWLTDDGSRWQQMEYRGLLIALGVLNVGWLLWAIPRLRRCIPSAIAAQVGTYLWLGLAALVVWILLMARPGTTSIHHGSYATVILLMAGLAILISCLPARFPLALVSLQVMLFSLCWVLFPVPPQGTPQPGMFAAAALAFLSIAGLLALLAYLDGEEELPSEVESGNSLALASSE